MFNEHHKLNAKNTCHKLKRTKEGDNMINTTDVRPPQGAALTHCSVTGVAGGYLTRPITKCRRKAFFLTATYVARKTGK